MAKVVMTRQTRQYLQLVNSAINAVLTSVDSFNRVYGEYKVETTLILLTNAWELLAKSILVKKRKNIFTDKAKKESISCEKALLQLQNLKEIEELQFQLLMQIVSLRNRAVHDVLPKIPEEIQHHLMFFACKFFKDLLEKHYPKKAYLLKKNFLTLSFEQLTTYATEVSKVISRLRRGTAADKELIWLLERGIRFSDNNEYMSQSAFENLYKNKRTITPYLKIGSFLDSVDMVRIVPIQAPKNYSADIELRKGSPKSKESLPVHVRKHDEYEFLTSDVASQIGKNTSFVARATTKLGIRGNPKYHTEVRTSSTGKIPKYTQEAITFLKDHLVKNPTYSPY